MTEDQLVTELKEAYATAKSLPAGKKATCPVCKTKFKKKFPHQAFCKGTGAGNCKDTYWNLTIEERRLRAKIAAKAKKG